MLKNCVGIRHGIHWNVVVSNHSLVLGGVRSSHFLSINPYIPPSGQQLHHSSGVCPQIQGRPCGVYVGAVGEMRWCVWVLQRGHSSDECNLASTLCKYDLRKGDLFVLSWTRVQQVNWGKSLFRAANVWWRCVWYFVITSCG